MGVGRNAKKCSKQKEEAEGPEGSTLHSTGGTIERGEPCVVRLLGGCVVITSGDRYQEVAGERDGTRRVKTINVISLACFSKI